MLDLTEAWVNFTWFLYEWAISPDNILPIFLAISGMTLVPKIPQWVRHSGKIVAVLLAVYLLLATPLMAFLLIKGLTVFLPASPPDTQADAIVVLSRGENLGFSRYHFAIQLWQEDFAPRIFVTTFDRAGYITDQLRKRGLPLSILDGTGCVRTTYEEALLTATILHPDNVITILLITDKIHMLRAALTFQGTGFTVTPMMVAVPSEIPALEKSLLALREYFGLTNYLILGRFRPHSVDTLEQKSYEELRASGCLPDWLDNLDGLTSDFN